MVRIQNSTFHIVKGSFLEYVSHVPEVSSSQTWVINVVQKGSGEQNVQKLAIFFYFRVVIKRCVLAEGVVCGTN